MNDITQIRIGQHMTGIIGLKEALAEVVSRDTGLNDEQIGTSLLEILSKQNYIETGLTDVYKKAFVDAYKKHIGAPVTETSGHALQIKVLGPGCPQCDRLEMELMSVMSQTGIAAELEHVRDLAEIARFGVMGSPALIIDGKVMAVGSVPSRERIKTWVVQAAQKASSTYQFGK